MGLFDWFKSSPSASFSSRDEVCALVNAFAATNASLTGELNARGGYVGHVVGSSPEEIKEFLRYIAVTRGRAFESVQIRYGDPNPPTFTAHVEFDTREIDKTKGYIIVTCGRCSARMQAPFNAAGKNMACTSCGTVNVVMMPSYKSIATVVDFKASSSPSFDLSNVYFKSSDHKRYQSGVWAGGDNKGCMRAIEIKPDTKFPDSYFVTLYNLDGADSKWRDNIQLATKRMKVVSSCDSEIILRGYGNDPMLAPGRPPQVQSDYGVILHLVDGGIDRISFLYHDRDVRLEFFKNVSSSANEEFEMPVPDEEFEMPVPDEESRVAALDDFSGLMAEYLQKMAEVGEIEEASPETAMVFQKAVIDRVGHCDFNILALMGIIDARRMIGKSDSEILEDLIRVQG